MNAPNHTLSDELNAALAWWQMAGVDYDYADDATDWLAEDEPASAAAGAGEAPETSGSAQSREPEQKPEKTVERRDLLGSTPPATLEEFRTFWLEAPGLDAIGPRGRIAPRGPSSPELMVLVTDPEESDRDTLLSGPNGRLLSNILAALGVAPESTYFASALPRHTPMADTASLAAGGLDAVTLHHVGLVSPQKLLVFGKSVLPLLGHDVSNAPQDLREINQNSQSLPVLVSEGLDSLMAMPRLKAKFWRRWIEWTAELR